MLRANSYPGVGLLKGPKPNFAPPSERVRLRMQGQPRANTKPEVALRSALHKLGLRFRIERRVLPDLRRTADIVFPAKRVVCFVHGCFWHGCLEHKTWPKRNAEFWRAKILYNKRKDRDTAKRLARAGWKVIVCWEHEAPAAAAARVNRLLRAVEARKA